MSERFSQIDARTFRLISSADHKPPVLQPLAASFGALQKLADLEGVTSGRQITQQKGLPGIPANMLATGYGFTFINASFSYCKSNGNRFNPAEWGAWYSAFSLETALMEVSFHLTRALESCGADYDNTTYCTELLATFGGMFCDLRGIDPVPDCLHPDTEKGYPSGQSLARGLRDKGCNGLVYPSVRHDGGTCLVAFWPNLVRDFQKGETWILKWAGDAKPTIAKAPVT